MKNKDVGLMVGEIYDDILEYTSPYEMDVMKVIVNKCLEFGLDTSDIPVEFINLTEDELTEYLGEKE